MTTGAYRIVVEKGRSKGRAFRIKPNGKCVVGRDQRNNLKIIDPQTSRRHFEIEGKLGEFVLRDLNSSNGTFVNGERIKAHHTLAPGDKIAIGDTLVYFLEETDEDASNRKGDLSGRELAGYRIGRLLGRGGMGTVYEAVQVSLERTVALKVLGNEFASNPEFIQRFISEARAAGRLNHANIVAVFDVGQADDLYFYSMEYMAGGSIEDLVRKDGALPVAKTIPLIFDAARGLEYAEKHGLIHRDIKPDNLMLGADDVVKICDLGLATFSSRQHDVSGSPHYIAPEQALGKDINHRADLYALGVSWYQMLCGDTPFTGRSPQEIARKHVEEEPPPLVERAPETPPEVVALIELMMQKDPEQRIPSARQLQADLANLARRFPIRETVLLRIDAVAPDDPPSDELAAHTTSEEVASVRGALSWTALAILALALLGAAFLVTSQVMSGKKAEQAQALQAIQQVEALLEQDPAQAEQQAQALADQLEERGLTDLAEEATALAEEAAGLIAKAEDDAREQAARAKLDEATRLFEVSEPAPLGDPAAQARLEQLVVLLDTIVQDHGRTKAAEDAKALRRQVKAQLERILAAQEALESRKAEARRVLDRTKSGIKSLLEENLPGKYRQAVERVKEYIAEHGGVEPTGGQVLLEEIQRTARREVMRCRKEAIDLMNRRLWSEARAALNPVMPPLGFAELDDEVQATLRMLEAEKARAQDDVRREREREDMTRLRDSLRRIQEAVDDRRYGEAASRLRSDSLLLKVKRARRLSSLRVWRLERADAALALLAKQVNLGKHPVRLELEFPRVGRKRARAVEYDRRSRRYTFEHSPGIGKFVKLVDVAPADLLGFFEALPLDLSQKLDLACLARELGDRARAASLLEEVKLDPKLTKKVEQFIELDTAE